MYSRRIGKEVFNYPYQVISETIKRIAFLITAIEGSVNSTLLFDEPEAHTFPFYTHYIAERIALDTSNQYFLTTHNSYLLHSIVEKTPIDELNVGIVYMENYETKVRILTPEQLGELSETDIFYNLELFLEA
ncbi:MAG: AAA family ATPase [Saprospiraceae bacterium]|nr:AAA family ATPase [Saprospiraceae bacterium]